MKRNLRNLLSVCMLVAVLLVVLTGCTSRQETDLEGDTVDNQAVVGMANPVKEYDNLKQAEKAAGFTFIVPEGINLEGEDYAQYYWSTINRDLIEVRYGAKGNEVCYLRKAAYTKDSEDISGDYNVYDDVKKVAIGLEDGRESTVTLKGKDGKWYLALWQLKGTKDNGIWNYAVGIRGVPEEDLLELVKMVE